MYPLLSVRRGAKRGISSMRFSWKGLLLAPLLVPALFSGLLTGSSLLDFEHTLQSLLLFLVVLMAGSIISYGATIFLLLPSLYMLSQWRRRITWGEVCLLGAVLGLVVFVPVTAMEWKSSGPDSGPPTEPFLEFLWRWGADPFTLVFPAAGLVTTALYWWLAAPPRQAAPMQSGT
jgi:hypothetical protein